MYVVESEEAKRVRDWMLSQEPGVIPSLEEARSIQALHQKAPDGDYALEVTAEYLEATITYHLYRSTALSGEGKDLEERGEAESPGREGPAFLAAKARWEMADLERTAQVKDQTDTEEVWNAIARQRRLLKRIVDCAGSRPAASRLP